LAQLNAWAWVKYKIGNANFSYSHWILCPIQSSFGYLENITRITNKGRVRDHKYLSRSTKGESSVLSIFIYNHVRLLV